jgi:hypothetical protein
VGVLLLTGCDDDGDPVGSLEPSRSSVSSHASASRSRWPSQDQAIVLRLADTADQVTQETIDVAVETLRVTEG